MKVNNQLFLVAVLFTFGWFGCAQEEILAPSQVNNTSPSIDGMDSFGKKGRKPGHNRSRGKGLPLKGTVVYDFDPTVQLTCNCVNSQLGGSYFGTGNLTQLGKVNASSVSCFNSIFANDANGNPILIGFDVLNQCNTMFAANGDELITEVPSYTLLFDPNCACITGTVQVEIVGGTGRFANATGSYTSTVSQNPVNLVVTTVYDGKIYLNKGRSSYIQN